MAAPAIALGYGAIGMVAALVAGAFVARRLEGAGLRRAFGVSLGLVALVVGWIVYRVAVTSADREAVPAAPAGPVTAPVEPVAQRYPFVERADLPMGLGIAVVAPSPGGTLRFYSEPAEGAMPEDVAAVDSVTFAVGVPSVEIATAPPWLVPEHLKMDYELFHLRVVTLSPDWVEVIGNSSTGQAWWVPRRDVRFLAWPEFLLSVNSVETFDADANPVRYRPHPESDVLSASWAPLSPLAVSGAWMQVATANLADRIWPSGWIRWRDETRLLVTYNPFS